jgi:hypothetical protein
MDIGVEMSEEKKLKFLRVALFVFGAFFVVGIYPLMMSWTEGWRWTPHQTEYEQMILGVYATLGIFLMIASKNPLEHRSLIWFTIWSSVVHAGIMAVQSITDLNERGHLLGDVPALFLVAIILGCLMPKKRVDTD